MRMHTRGSSPQPYAEKHWGFGNWLGQVKWSVFTRAVVLHQNTGGRHSVWSSPSSGRLNSLQTTHDHSECTFRAETVWFSKFPSFFMKSAPEVCLKTLSFVWREWTHKEWPQRPLCAKVWCFIGSRKDLWASEVECLVSAALLPPLRPVPKSNSFTTVALFWDHFFNMKIKFDSLLVSGHHVFIWLGRWIGLDDNSERYHRSWNWHNTPHYTNLPNTPILPSNLSLGEGFERESVTNSHIQY